VLASNRKVEFLRMKAGEGVAELTRRMVKAG
jgi:hypothetical protein